MFCIEPYDFGLRLKELRKEKKLSQPALAQRLGVTKSTISAYERNVQTPRPDILVKMSLLFGKSIDYIMGIDNRNCIFLDGLSKEDQALIINSITPIINRLKNK